MGIHILNGFYGASHLGFIYGKSQMGIHQFTLRKSQHTIFDSKERLHQLCPNEEHGYEYENNGGDQEEKAEKLGQGSHLFCSMTLSLGSFRYLIIKSVIVIGNRLLLLLIVLTVE